MKKILLGFIVFMFLGFFGLSLNVFAGEASFKLESKEIIDLGYGVHVEHIKGTSKSSFNSTTTVDGRNQDIWTALIDKDSEATMVQWSYLPRPENAWANTTLQNIARDYESKHPDKKVLVATNNWLASTTSQNVGELDAVQICDGLNYRVSDKQGSSENPQFHVGYGHIPRPNILGFDLEGKVAYFSDDFGRDDYSDYLELSYYNGIDTLRTKLNISVKYLNQVPAENEIAIIFKNYNGDVSAFNGYNIYLMKGLGIRHDNEVGSDDNERDPFAYGTFVEKVNSIDFSRDGANSYYFVSRNKDFDALDLTDKTLVCQYELLGELANIYGATTYYYHIVRNGVAYNVDTCPWANWNEINCEVHPRTAFLIKEDGSFGLSVIDGRQKDAVGMDYEDMANFYLQQYNAKEVFNYDGGGSSAMIISRGLDFELLNSPSDGNMRGVGNACLIVVDRDPFVVGVKEQLENKISLEISNVDDNVNKVFVELNGNKKEVIDNVVSFEGLTNKTLYTFKVSYLLDDYTSHDGMILNVKTTPIYPTVTHFDCTIVNQNTLNFVIGITDPDKFLLYTILRINGKYHKFDGLSCDYNFDELPSNTDLELVVEFTCSNGDFTIITEEKFNVSTPVAEYPESIKAHLDKDLYVDSTAKLVIDVTPDGTKDRYTYESDDEEVATVSNTGRVTGVSEGDCFITITSEHGLTYTVLISVLEKVTPVVNPPVEDVPEKKKGCQKGIVFVAMVMNFSVIFTGFYFKKH